MRASHACVVANLKSQLCNLRCVHLQQHCNSCIAWLACDAADEETADLHLPNCIGDVYCLCLPYNLNMTFLLQDTVPAENSVISMLMKANNKVTGKPFAPL